MPRSLWDCVVAEYPAMRAHLVAAGAEEVVKCSQTGRDTLAVWLAVRRRVLGGALDRDHVTPYVNHPIVLCVHAHRPAVLVSAGRKQSPTTRPPA